MHSKSKIQSRPLTDHVPDLVPTIIPVILGSFKDKKHFDTINNFMTNFNTVYKTNVKPVMRVCSAHKNSVHLQTIMDEYEEVVPCFMTIAGKSNALSAVVDSMTTRPVFACPPISSKSNNLHDLYSTVMMPSGVSPMLVLNYENACLAVLKTVGLVNSHVRESIYLYKKALRDKIRLDDLRLKATYVKERLEDNTYNMGVKHSMYETEDFTNNLIKKGKVRDIYQNFGSPTYTMRATNRLSAFDRAICDIPFKGQVLNEISMWWFNKTKHIIPNHVQCSVRDRETDLNDGMMVTVCEPFMVEFVVRSYMTGSTKTSIWKNYERGMRHYCGHFIRDGYSRNQSLDEVIVTPTTKGDVSDELIDAEGIISSGLMTREEWEYCERKSLELFKYGQKVAEDFGMILVDTKYEFGKAPDGTIMLIDEIHTPDSSRYWVQHSYIERFNKGEEPENIDKDIIRKWIKKNYDDPYSMSSKDLKVPDELVELVSQRYLELQQIIMG